MSRTRWCELFGKRQGGRVLHRLAMFGQRLSCRGRGTPFDVVGQGLLRCFGELRHFGRVHGAGRGQAGSGRYGPPKQFEIQDYKTKSDTSPSSGSGSRPALTQAIEHGLGQPHHRPAPACEPAGDNTRVDLGLLLLHRHGQHRVRVGRDGADRDHSECGGAFHGVAGRAGLVSANGEVDRNGAGFALLVLDTDAFAVARAKLV